MSIYPCPPGGKVPERDDQAGALALDPNYVLPSRIAWWAERDPDRPFLVEVSGRTASYGETFDGIRRWARVLRDRGVRPGDCVLSMLPASIDAHLLWMAASCIGACEVPINPELRGEFLEHALRDAGARLCFTRPEAAALPQSTGIDGLEVVTVDREKPFALNARPDEISLPRPEDRACVIYTSGTTGPAKGAIVSWAQMTATVGRIPRSWLSEKDAVYSCHPMFHVTGRSPMPAMSDVGGRVVLREHFSLKAFWEDVRQYGCTSTTAFVGLLLGQPQRDDDRDNPLRVVFGGADGRANRRFSERFDVQTLAFYGSTEAGFPIGLRWGREEAEKRRDCGWLRNGYAGRVSNDAGQEVADGVAGELHIRPPSRSLMTLGYLGKPEQTAKAIRDGWYRTGDRLIRHPDGSFEFVDRMRDTIRRMGENISSSALEASVLADSEVQECAAIGVPHPTTGQDVALVVVLVDGSTIDPPALYSRLTEQLPRYMHPTYIAVAEADALPRTPTRKIRKVALLEAIDLDAAWRSPRAIRPPDHRSP